MRWFKHMTGSATDEKLCRVIDELGMEGYGFYWRLLEIIASQMDETDKTFCVYSPKVWGKLTGFSPIKFSKVAGVLSNFQLIFVESSTNLIKVDCPNLLKYKDEWNTRKSKTRESLGSYSGVTREPYTDTDTDTDKKEPPIAPQMGGALAGTEQPKIENPEKHEKPKPQARPDYHTAEGQERRATALSILHELNDRCNKRFPDHYAGLNVIEARLSEGRTHDEFSRIITVKLRDPHFQKNRNLYDPRTLFATAERFDVYLNQDPEGFGDVPQVPKPPPADDREHPYICKKCGNGISVCECGDEMRCSDCGKHIQACKCDRERRAG